MPILIYTGIIMKILCRSRDNDGGFMLLQAQNENLGIINLRAKDNHIPNKLLPHLIGAPIEFAWSDSQDDVGILLALPSQNPNFIHAMFTLAINLSVSHEYKRIPFCIDPFSNPIYKNVTNENIFSSQNNEFITNDPEVNLDLEDNEEEIEEGSQDEELF